MVEIVVALFLLVYIIQNVKSRNNPPRHVRPCRYTLNAFVTDESCIRNLRMDHNAFGQLCYILEHSGRLSGTQNVTIFEQVALFLSVISHHKKNYTVKHDFLRFGRTVSKHFHAALNTISKMHNVFLAKPAAIKVDCSDPKWKWFKFIYVLSGWEGSAADSCVLRDAIHRRNDLQVPSEVFTTTYINGIANRGASKPTGALQLEALIGTKYD
ncbi:hypothetical protein Sango_2055900 [Sesamum angolense]|uniref:DUF8040 domain-containing protein n=1 Tax=Sesamum angolense TaxID=2727404 RepID=A0AAE2BP88_9LAMI|nr:hypothetical protein Sango_2055900 [Sesamum angolense]